MRKKGAEIVKLELKAYQCGIPRGKGDGLRNKEEKGKVLLMNRQFGKGYYGR